MKRAIFIFSVLSLIFSIIAFVLLTHRKEEPSKEPQLLLDRKINEIEEIHISNQYNTYSVTQQDGGFVIADLPMDLIYPDYLLMLLDEASRVEYTEQIIHFKKPAPASLLAAYGLDSPVGTVNIRYSSSEITLIFGAVEPVSQGQYFMLKEGDTVYLMDHSRVVRFLQPLKRFFNLEIVPVRNVPSPLSTIKKLILSGKSFPRPIVIDEINTENEEEMREALSFGATTHLIKSPELHKIDQKEAIDVFGSLSGLLNIDDAAFAKYGFNDPLVKAEYIFQKGDGSEPISIVLRVAFYNGDYILVRDNQRVVHRMEEKPFFVTSYEKLCSRWFLTPFITDVTSIVIHSGRKDYRFELSGEQNHSLEASLNGKKIDMTLFRKFYTLLISASRDGPLLENSTPLGPPVLTVTFHYRDPLKNPDTMSFSPGSFRRNYVTVNGTTEFACLERYAMVVETSISALERGEDFGTDW